MPRKNAIKIKLQSCLVAHLDRLRLPGLDFTSLKCGGAYLIYLEKGTGKINIPNFVASYSNQEPKGRISDCYPMIEKTPTPTILPFVDTISIDSVCPISETNQNGSTSFNTMHLSIKYSTEVERNLNLSLEKIGLTQPLFQKLENKVIGNGVLNFLIRTHNLNGDASVGDIDRVAVFLCEVDKLKWSDRIASEVKNIDEWDCNLVEPDETPTPIVQQTPTPTKPPTSSPTSILQQTPTPATSLVECCPDSEFDVKVTTTGGRVELPSITISGFEPNGQICMSELDLNDISSSGTTLVDPTGGSLFGGSINFSIQPINKLIRYTSPSGKCYVGEVSSTFSLLQEV